MTLAPPDPRQRATQERAAESITEALLARLLRLVDDGVQLTELGAAESVATTLLETLPLASTPWAAIVGPCYTSGALQREIVRGRGALSKAVGELRALRLETADHQTVYPSFQVHNGALVPGLRDVLSVLREGDRRPVDLGAVAHRAATGPRVVTSRGARSTISSTATSTQS